MMVGVDNKICFKYVLITQSSKIVPKFKGLGHVRDRIRSGRPSIPTEEQLNVLLTSKENPTLSSGRQIGFDYNVGKTPVLKTFYMAKFHTCKVKLCIKRARRGRILARNTILRRINSHKS